MDHVWELRLKSVVDAQASSRYVLVTGMLLAFAFVVSAWNSYLSWDRYLVQEWKADVTEDGDQKMNSVVKKLREAHASKWISDRAIAVSPIGLVAGVHDIVPICTMAMTTVAIWMLFAIRREVRVYHRFVTESLTDERRRQVFVTISDHSLFFAVEPEAKRRVIRIIPLLIAFTPLLTILIAWIGDVASIFMTDVFEESGTMWDVIRTSSSLKRWLVAVYAIYALASALCFYLCFHTLQAFYKAEELARILREPAHAEGGI